VFSGEVTAILAVGGHRILTPAASQAVAVLKDVQRFWKQDLSAFHEAGRSWKATFLSSQRERSKAAAVSYLKGG
jgi:hypothetical protein